MDASEVDDYNLDDVSSLVEAHITCLYYFSWAFILSQLPHVECLMTQNCWYEILLCKHELAYPLPQSFMLYNLKKLELQTGYSKSEVIGLVAVLKRCPNLQHLTLFTVNIPEELLRKPIKLNLPFVKKVTIRCCYGTPEESEMANLLEDHGKIVIQDFSGPKSSTQSVTRHKASKFLGERTGLSRLYAKPFTG